MIIPRFGSGMYFVVNVILNQEADGEIQVAVHRETNDNARIAFSGLGTKGDPPFPSEGTKNIAMSIGAEIRMADEGRTIDILVAQLFENSG